MAKAIKFSLSLICLFLILSTVCKYARADSLIEYYPLEDQNVWKYEITTADNMVEIEEIKVDGKEDINGQKAIRMIYAQGGYYDLLAVDQEGVKLYKTIDIEGGHVVYNPALIILPFLPETAKADKKEYIFLEYDKENNVTGGGGLILEIEFSGKENITVPAGIFQFSSC